jgi:Tannase and feruloyl esterase
VTPPDPILQTLGEQTPPDKVMRTRPLCRYPKYPRYKGKGDPEKMESYACAMPDLGTIDTSASKR